MGKQAQLTKQTQALTKVLRNVASSEPNRKLQTSLFLYAQKYELLELDRAVYQRCEVQVALLLDEAKYRTISPLRVSIYIYIL